MVYTPPEGEDRLRGLLANWERFLHDATDLDPLIRMAVGHYQFEAIHPFTDGNGRTGRILNLLFMPLRVTAGSSWSWCSSSPTAVSAMSSMRASRSGRPRRRY